MKTYINPQTQVIVLQSDAMNCQEIIFVASVEGDFRFGPGDSCVEQM